MTNSFNSGLVVVAFAIGLGLPLTASDAADLGCNGPCNYEAPATASARTFMRRIENDPGAYEIAREPSLYGWVTREVTVDQDGEWDDRGSYKDGGHYTESADSSEEKRVLIRPYKNIAIYHSARHNYVKDNVVIATETTDGAHRSWKD